MKSRLIGKDPDAGKDPYAGKDERQKEKGAAEDETVREHHQLSGRESEQTLGESKGQGSLAHVGLGHDLATVEQQQQCNDIFFQIKKFNLFKWKDHCFTVLCWFWSYRT